MMKNKNNQKYLLIATNIRMNAIRLTLILKEE